MVNVKLMSTNRCFRRHREVKLEADDGDGDTLELLHGAEELELGPAEELELGPAEELELGPADELELGLADELELGAAVEPELELGPELVLGPVDELELGAALELDAPVELETAAELLGVTEEQGAADEEPSVLGAAVLEVGRGANAAHTSSFESDFSAELGSLVIQLHVSRRVFSSAEPPWASTLI
jgi:hypothetical protein